MDDKKLAKLWSYESNGKKKRLDSINPKVKTIPQSNSQNGGIQIQSNLPIKIFRELNIDFKHNIVYNLSLNFYLHTDDETGFNVFLSNKNDHNFFNHPKVFDYKFINNDSLVINGWNKLSFNFMVDDKENQILIDIPCGYEKLSHIVFDSIVLIELGHPEELFPENLIINGGFDYYTKVSGNIFQGTRELSNWQIFNLSGIKCIENRGQHKASIIIDQDGELYNGIVDLGSPDLNHPNLYDSVHAVGGYGFGRLNTHPVSGLKKNEAFGEYFQTRLKQPLIKDSIYIFQIYIKNDPTSTHCSNTLGVKLTECLLEPIDSLSFIDHTFTEPSFLIDSGRVLKCEEWTKFSIEYIAKGNETILTIGAFSVKSKNVMIEPRKRRGRKNHGAYYLIDEITLTEKSRKSTHSKI